MLKSFCRLALHLHLEVSYPLLKRFTLFSNKTTFLYNFLLLINLYSLLIIACYTHFIILKLQSQRVHYCNKYLIHFQNYSQMNLKQYIMWYNFLMAYSIDFRKKVLSYCERTGSITEASHIFQISRNTIYGWLKLKEKTGELNHQVTGTKPRKVDRDRLKNYLTDNPDAYLTEIASEFGCHPTTIHYALKAMGYTRKKRITPTMNKTQKK